MKSLTCFYIIRWDDDKMFKASKRFFKKEKNIRWNLKLNYQQLLLADLEEVTSIMAIAYLEAIETYFKNFKPDFDGKRFHKEVKQLFQEQGWLVETPISI